MMLEIYKTPSKEIQEIILANLTYETVIEGLNGYFASEPRDDYITVKMESDDIKQDFALYAAEAWADILISWLRTEHGIFYYPGMEAKHAKSEKIKPFTERKMDEGALDSLKKLNKIVTGKEAGTDCIRIIADGIRYAVNAKESEIKKLKGRITELESKFKAVCDEDDILRARALKAEVEVQKLKSRINVTAQKEAKQECYKYLWNALKILSPDCDALKIDRYEDLVDRIFYEMSRVEVNCKQCQRKNSTGKLMVEDYEVKLKNYILKDIKKHGYRYDGLETKSIEEIVDRIIQIATCPRNEWANCEIENLRGQISRLKDLINVMNKEVGDM